MLPDICYKQQRTLNPNLDDTISRYLDGELTPAQQAWLTRAMAESPEVAARVNQAVLAARTARRTPTLHHPPAHVTHALFQQLAAEGLHAPVAAILPPPTLPLRRRGIHYVRTATVVAVVALLAAVVIGDGALTNAPRRNPELAVAIAPTPFAGQHPTSLASLLPPQQLRGERRGKISQRSAKMVKDFADGVAPNNAPTVQQPNQEAAIGSDGNKESIGQGLEESMASVMKQENHLAHQPELPPQQAVSEGVETAEATDAADLSISASSGVAYLLKGAGSTRQETAIKVTLAFNSGHAVSVVGGYSPRLRGVDDALAAKSELQPTSTNSSTDFNESGNTGRLQRSDKSTVAAELPERAEPWLGVGYNYAVALHRDIQVAPGIVAGAGATSWRVGAELPVRYRLVKEVSVELVAAANYVRPYPEQRGGFDFTDDANHYHYYSTPSQAAFTAIGVRLGVAVALPTGD